MTRRRASTSTTPSSCCRCPASWASTRPTARRSPPQNGRYGPYLQKVGADGKKDSRSLTNEEQLLTVTLDDARGALRPAQAAAGPGGQAAAARARRGPGQRQADGDQGRPVRPLRHRRRDQRVAAQVRRRRDHHRRAGRRSCWPTGASAARPRRRRQEGTRRRHAKKAAKKARRPQEGAGQEVAAKKAAGRRRPAGP